MTCSVYLKHPDGKVMIHSEGHGKQSPVVLHIPQQPADSVEPEDDTEQVFVPDRGDTMKAPLIS
jgi:hypothetical protein